MSAIAELPILYLDESLVVINKPSKLAVHKGWARDERYAMTILRDQLGAWVYPVHRLDRATSGALLMALTPEDARALSLQFEARSVAKRYGALVRGVMPERGVIDRPIAKKRGGQTYPALTEYERLWVYADRYSWLSVTPKTGRAHQIRRHLRGLSHPIIGDVRYGRGEENRRFRAEFELNRLALHAAVISFDHPRGGGRLTVEAPLPDDLRGPLRAMGAPSDLLAPAPRLCDRETPPSPERPP